MEVRQMRYFLAVAEALHFRHASETLHLSQPALSLQIQQLEEELGVKLLSRSTRNVQLTRAGEALVARIRTILSSIDDAVNNTKRVAKGLELPLSISYVSTALAGVLPRAMRALQLDTPGVEFELHDCRPKEQIAGLLQETTDIGFMHVKIEDEQLLSKLIQRYDLVAALPAAMNYEGPVDLKELSHCTVIMQRPWGVTSFGAYNHVQRAFQLAGIEPVNVIHATINGGLRLVASGVGISVVPVPAEQTPIEGVTFRPLLKPPPPIDLIAVWNRNSKARLLHRFLEILDEVQEVSPDKDCVIA